MVRPLSPSWRCVERLTDRACGGLDVHGDVGTCFQGRFDDEAETRGAIWVTTGGTAGRESSPPFALRSLAF
jgi:hypothetical protein